MKVLHPNDLRGTSDEFDQAIADVILGLQKKKAFRVDP